MQSTFPTLELAVAEKEEPRKNGQAVTTQNVRQVDANSVTVALGSGAPFRKVTYKLTQASFSVFGSSETVVQHSDCLDLTKDESLEYTFHELTPSSQYTVTAELTQPTSATTEEVRRLQATFTTLSDSEGLALRAERAEGRLAAHEASKQSGAASATALRAALDQEMNLRAGVEEQLVAQRKAASSAASELQRSQKHMEIMKAEASTFRRTVEELEGARADMLSGVAEVCDTDPRPDLPTALQDLTETVQLLRAELDDKEAVVQDLTRQLEEAKDSMAATREASAQRQEDAAAAVAGLEEKLQAAQSECTEVRTALQEQVQELQGSLAESKRELEAQTAKLAEAKAELASYEQRQQQVTSELSDMQQLLKEAKEEASKHLVRAESSEAEAVHAAAVAERVEGLQARIAELTAERDAAQAAQAEAADSAKKDAAEAAAAASGRIEELLAAVEAADQARAECDKRVTFLEGQLHALSKEGRDVLRSLRSMAVSVGITSPVPVTVNTGVLPAVAARVETALAELCASMEAEEVDLGGQVPGTPASPVRMSSADSGVRLKECIQAAQAAMRRNAAGLAAAQEKLAASEASQRELRAEIAELREAVVTKEAQLVSAAKARVEQEHAAADVDALRSEVAAAKQEAEDILRAKKRLEREQGTAVLRNAELEEQLRSTQEEVMAVNKANADLRGEVAALRLHQSPGHAGAEESVRESSEVAVLRAQLKQAEEEASGIAQQLAAAELELNTCTANLASQKSQLQSKDSVIAELQEQVRVMSAEVEAHRASLESEAEKAAAEHRLDKDVILKVANVTCSPIAQAVKALLGTRGDASAAVMDLLGSTHVATPAASAVPVQGGGRGGH